MRFQFGDRCVQHNSVYPDQCDTILVVLPRALATGAASCPDHIVGHVWTEIRPVERVASTATGRRSGSDRVTGSPRCSVGAILGVERRGDGRQDVRCPINEESEQPGRPRSLPNGSLNSAGKGLSGAWSVRRCWSNTEKTVKMMAMGTKASRMTAVSSVDNPLWSQTSVGSVFCLVGLLSSRSWPMC